MVIKQHNTDEGSFPLEVPDGFSGLRPFIEEKHPFAESVGRVLRGETALGERIQPLLHDLSQRALNGGLNALEPSAESFTAIYGFLRDRDLSDIDLGKDDLLFLTTTNLGDLLRRPIINTWVAGRLDRDIQVEEDPGNQIKELLLRIIKSSAWSKFIDSQGVLDHILEHHAEDNVFVDMAGLVTQVRAAIESGGNLSDLASSSNDAIRQWEERYLSGLSQYVDAAPSSAFLVVDHRALDESFKLSPALASEVLDRMMKLTVDYRNAYGALIDEEYEHQGHPLFKTEPGHAFGQSATLNGIYQSTIAVMKRKQSGRTLSLNRELSVLICEDNPAHMGIFAGREEVENWVMYSPHPECPDPVLYGPQPKNVGMTEANIEHLKREEETGIIRAAERAQQVIKFNVEHEGKPPDILVTDIELDGSMDGLELIRHLKEKYPEMIVYYSMTSNYRRYMDELAQRLNTFLADKTVRHGWDKDHLSLEGFVDQVNEDVL